MIYNYFLTAELNSDRLREALALAFAVPLASVDVSAADDYDRDWEAAVACGYEQSLGDATWSLDIVCGDEQPGTPTEKHVALVLAEELGQAVLFPAEPFPPSAYWLSAPGGLRTRARLYEEDGEDGPHYVIDAVGRPVPGLPGLRVDRQPEVIREHRVPTPTGDGFSAWVAAHRESQGRAAAPRPGEPEWYAATRLGAWEALTVRMTANWPPDGWYPADYYREDLETRDELEGVAQRLDPDVVQRFTAVLAEIDQAFRDATVETPGAALPEALGGSGPETSHRGWWWHRLPPQLPWGPEVPHA